MKEIEEEIKVTFRNQEFTISHKYWLDEDTGQKYTTPKQDDDMMWAVFRAYWERKGFEHFYEIDGYRKEQEPASEELEEKPPISNSLTEEGLFTFEDGSQAIITKIG